jgi:hypothetical protein
MLFWVGPYRYLLPHILHGQVFVTILAKLVLLCLET